MNIQAKYLTYKKGKKRMVLLSVNTYRRIMQYLEDMEDSLDLKKAKQTGHSFIELNQFISKLKRA